MKDFHTKSERKIYKYFCVFANFVDDEKITLFKGGDITKVGENRYLIEGYHACRVITTKFPQWFDVIVPFSKRKILIAVSQLGENEFRRCFD